MKSLQQQTGLNDNGRNDHYDYYGQCWSPAYWFERYSENSEQAIF